MNEIQAPQTEQIVAAPPPSRRADPLRRWTLAIVILCVLLFGWTLIADRLTPYTSDASVRAFVVRMVPEVSGKVVEVAVKDNQIVRRTFWISLGAVLPLLFGHFAQVGLWAGFLVLLGALQTYNDAFYFSLVTFATLGYGDIVLAPGYRIFGALGATCGSLMLGWSTALIFAAISRAIDRGRA
jgi:hypothetical protein